MRDVHEAGDDLPGGLGWGNDLVLCGVVWFDVFSGVGMDLLGVDAICYVITSGPCEKAPSSAKRKPSSPRLCSQRPYISMA